MHRASRGSRPDAVPIARTAPFAVLTLRLTPIGAPVVEAARLATGVRFTAYDGSNAPAGFPSAARNGASDVSVTFAASYQDSYGVSAPFSLTHVKAGAIYQSVVRVMPEIVSPSVVRLRAFNAADAAITEALPPRLREPIEDRNEVPADGVAHVVLTAC